MTTEFNTLKKEIAELRDRIHRLETDIKCPLEADFAEQAPQLSDRSLHWLLEIEKENLARRELELKNLGH